MDMTQRKMNSMKAPLVLYLRCCPPHCHYIISHAVLGCAVFVDIRTPRPPSADCGWWLVAGGWWLVAGCAAADLVPAAPVEPGRGLDTGTIPPTYWGMVGANTGDHGADTAPVLS